MSRWLVPATFAALAIGAAAHAVATVGDAVAHPSARAALTAVYFALRMGIGIAFAVLTYGRAEPKRRARDPRAWLACAVAMLVMLPLGGPGAATSVELVLTGDLIAVIACAWLLASVLTLGRCFGVLPEARGLVTSGPYRFVRHPVYLGEIGALAGLTLCSPAAVNVAALAVFIAAQTARMRMEEAALQAAFTEYRSYAANTGRLLPRLRRRPAEPMPPVDLTLPRQLAA